MDGTKTHGRCAQCLLTYKDTCSQTAIKEKSLRIMTVTMQRVTRWLMCSASWRGASAFGSPPSRTWLALAPPPHKLVKLMQRGLIRWRHTTCTKRRAVGRPWANPLTHSGAGRIHTPSTPAHHSLRCCEGFRRWNQAIISWREAGTLSWMIDGLVASREPLTAEGR